MTSENYQRAGLFELTVPEGGVHHNRGVQQQVGMGPEREAERSHALPKVQSRESELEGKQGCILSKPSPSDTLSPLSPHPLSISRTATNWGCPSL